MVCLLLQYKCVRRCVLLWFHMNQNNDQKEYTVPNILVTTLCLSVYACLSVRACVCMAVFIMYVHVHVYVYMLVHKDITL